MAHTVSEYRDLFDLSGNWSHPMSCHWRSTMGWWVDLLLSSTHTQSGLRKLGTNYELPFSTNSNHCGSTWMNLASCCCFSFPHQCCSDEMLSTGVPLTFSNSFESCNSTSDFLFACVWQQDLKLHTVRFFSLLRDIFVNEPSIQSRREKWPYGNFRGVDYANDQNLMNTQLLLNRWDLSSWTEQFSWMVKEMVGACMRSSRVHHLFWCITSVAVYFLFTKPFPTNFPSHLCRKSSSSSHNPRSQDMYSMYCWSPVHTQRWGRKLSYFLLQSLGRVWTGKEKLRNVPALNLNSFIHIVSDCFANHLCQYQES